MSLVAWARMIVSGWNDCPGPAVDDLYIRRSLGPANAAHAELPRPRTRHAIASNDRRSLSATGVKPLHRT